MPVRLATLNTSEYEIFIEQRVTTPASCRINGQRRVAILATVGKSNLVEVDRSTDLSPSNALLVSTLQCN